MYVLGYLPKENRVFLGDKDVSVVSFALSLSVLEYQTAVMRQDFDAADKFLPQIPVDQRTRVAHFLEKQVQPVCFCNVIRLEMPIEKAWSAAGQCLSLSYCDLLNFHVCIPCHSARVDNSGVISFLVSLNTGLQGTSDAGDY